jgi:hypothetical protein
MSVFRSVVNGDKTGVNLQYNAKKASTAIAENTLLTLDAAGQLIPAVAASTFVVGVAVGRVTAADEDYAATSAIGFDQALDGDRFIMSVDDASTAGFVNGVTRAIVNAGQIKAAAVGADAPLVRVHKVFTATDEAEVSLISLTNQS